MHITELPQWNLDSGVCIVNYLRTSNLYSLAQTRPQARVGRDGYGSYVALNMHKVLHKLSMTGHWHSKHEHPSGHLGLN